MFGNEEVVSFASRMQRLLYDLVRNYESCDKMCLARHDLTAAQAYTLMALPTSPDMTMNDLSETMGLANSTMTRMVDTLVSKGLVYRRHDEEDRRVVRAGLTAKGQEVRRGLEREQERLFGQILSGIGEDERTSIIQALERIKGLFGNILKTCCLE